MPTPDKAVLESLGLGGDGDEVDAIEAVERRFGVILDKGDAANWLTAGDVFSSLLRTLPPDRRDPEAAWPLFCEAICEKADADRHRVGPETLLLGIPLRDLSLRWLDEIARGRDPD